MSKKKATAQVDHVVTQDTLDLNPDLAEQGVKVGETIQYPADPQAAKASDEIIAELQAENEALRAQLTQCEADYKEQLTQQDQETEDLRTQLKEAMEIVADATAGFNKTAAMAPNTLEAEVNGKKFKVNHGVHFEGKQYTAQDLVEDTEVLEKLLAIGSGSITLID
jgi:seryl-tRNA synthetase